MNVLNATGTPKRIKWQVSRLFKNLSIFKSLRVYAYFCMYVDTLVRVRVHTCVHVWRPEVDVGNHP